jgi:CubicO group peptidase (beta-lactamase class C family)
LSIRRARHSVSKAVTAWGVLDLVEQRRLSGAAALVASFDHSVRPQPLRRYTATAAASLHASARDLARFAQAWLRPNPVLHASTTASMMRPQPGTSGSWGLGVTLFAPNGADGYVIGHDGGTPPAWGASMRLNPATGNGVVILVSGGRVSVTKLADDWLYWETGQVTASARRQTLYNLARPALVIIFIGMMAIALWQSGRRASRR